MGEEAESDGALQILDLKRDAPVEYPEYTEPVNIKGFLLCLVVLVLVCFVLLPNEYVIKCGIDSQGPYARVLIDNLFPGKYHNSNWTGVNFLLNGKSYGGGRFDRPAHSITVVTVRKDGPHPVTAAKKIPDDGTLTCSTFKDY